MEFAKLTSKELPKRRIFLYGDTSSGKTHLIGTAQDVVEMADILHGNIDGGGSTLISRGDILSSRTKLAADVEKFLWHLAKPAASRIPELQTVGTAALDGVTDMQKTDLAGIAAAAALKKDTRNKDLNELQDYKLNKSKMERIIRMACDLNDLWLIASAWAKKTYPTDSSGQQLKTMPPIKIEPDLTDALSKTVRGLFDDVWYLEKRKDSETRVLYTSEYKGIFAKTRDPAVAAEMTTEVQGQRLPYIVNPTFPDLIARYKRAYKLV